MRHVNRPSRADTKAIVGAVVLALVLGAIWWWLGALSNQVRESQAQSQALYKQVQQLGKTPVVTPSPGATVAVTGPPGPAPSDAQVRRAVDAYCGSHTCRGPRGEQGKGPSKSDVAAAVRAYCDANGQCKGEVGQQGPPPDDTQVAAAVASYCAAHDQCQGEVGPRGEKGEKGETGDRGPAGAAGKDGSPGPEPKSFTFTFLGQDYVCRDPDGNGSYSCDTA